MGEYSLTAWHPTMTKIMEVLSDGQPKSSAQISELTGIKPNAVWAALRRYWHKKLVLRSKTPLKEPFRTFKGRAGIRRNLRSYHLYLLKPRNIDSLVLKGIEFVGYDRKIQGCCSGNENNSKASLILRFIRENSHRAYFTTEIVRTLSCAGVKQSDIMSNVRRWEKKGLVFVRGYKLDEKQTPFAEGYLVTWIDPSKPREEAIKEAVDKTELALKDKVSSNPTIQRVHRIRDLILEYSRLRELVSFTFIREHLGCSKYVAEVAIRRALQLYPDLREIKLFSAFRYFYHNSIAENDLKAAIAMKENYIRMTKGKANRIGHNWEAVAEWFIDKFTTGARFWTQNHRTNGMDPRRITVHLIKGVGGRKRNAEVDRVWEVTPGIFAPPITYVLSCKWGLVCKRDVDDFLEVLRWSKEFGVNTLNGREIKQGVVGVFAGGSFNPKEYVHLRNDCPISLASYAARMNIQLLKAADFNAKLRQRGCPMMVNVQKICRVAKDERQVREILENVWKDPGKSEKVLDTFAQRNKSVYEFEKMLEQV